VILTLAALMTAILPFYRSLKEQQSDFVLSLMQMEQYKSAVRPVPCLAKLDRTNAAIAVEFR
jgi:hypothetical protein